MQALDGFMIFGTTASFLAGFVQERLGWCPLTRFLLALLALATGAVLWLRLQPAFRPAAVKAAWQAMVQPWPETSGLATLSRLSPPETVA